jgi:hypothetical protein
MLSPPPCNWTVCIFWYTFLYFCRDISSAIFSLLQHFQYFILLASFIAHNVLCNWCHQYSLWQESSINRSKFRTEQRISYKRTAFSRFSVYSINTQPTRGCVLTWRCRCPITVPGRGRCGSSVPGTGLRCRVAFLFLGREKKWLV